MGICIKCLHYNYEKPEIEIVRLLAKQVVLDAVRQWLDEEVQFNGNYYQRRRFATAVDLEKFILELLK